MELKNFKWDQDADGIVTLTWDVPGRTMNVLTGSAISEIAQVAEKVASDATIKGLVITSGKANGFCAGAALDEMESGANAAGGKTKSAEEAIAARYQGVMQFHHALRKLETCGKPVAAAINGLALGGGLEVTLACHYRVVADNPKIQLGLPEAKVGLLPGGGGTQRLPRIIGAMAAFPMLLQGKSVDPQAALSQKIVHKVANDVVGEAKAWIKSKPEAVQPWDKKDFKLPGGGPFSPGGGQIFTMANSMLRKESYNNYPAQRFILDCVYEGVQVPMDAALRIEARYFTKLLMMPESRNMIRTLFLSMQDLGKGARRPHGEPKTDVKNLGVLGAGVMGAGIAYVSALAGIDVTLVDTTDEKAKAGLDHCSKLLDKQIERGKSTPEKKAEISRIHPTTDFGALKAVEFVIEAVFEDRAVKADVTKKADAVIGATAIYGSNTSTLPITGLAEASARPENFIGVHFFSPVDRMGLVEIIMGKKTNARALATAVDFVQKIKKTPIVVNDSRGFYTSRCFGTYTREGMAMLAEGIAPALIENVGRMAGMPMGSLEVTDSVGIDTALKITRASKKELGITTSDPSEDMLGWIVDKNGRYGRKNAKGFYDYDERGKRLRIWPDLLKYGTGKWRTDCDVEEMRERFLTIQALEAARCFEEGVITDPRDADVGAILGWGFAPYTGGPVSYIDTIGAKKFVERCDAFAAKFGDRFRPNKLLREMAEKGETFYSRFAPQKQAA